MKSHSPNLRVRPRVTDLECRTVPSAIPADAVVIGAGQGSEPKVTVLDPTTGEDLAEFEPASWRGRMTAVFQDFIHYPMTAIDNVALGLAMAGDDDQALVAAARKAMVDELIAFARRSGYYKIRLWTQSVLLAARHVYASTGFELTGQEQHHSFGQDLVAENWELRL